MIKRLFFAAMAFVIFSRTYGESKNENRTNRLLQENGISTGLGKDGEPVNQALKEKVSPTGKIGIDTKFIRIERLNFSGS